MAETDFAAVVAGDFFAATGLAAGFFAAAVFVDLLAAAFGAAFLAAGFAAAFFAGAFALAAGFFAAAVFVDLLAAAFGAAFFTAGFAAAFLAGAFALAAALAAVFGLAAGFFAATVFVDLLAATFDVALAFDILTSSLGLILSFGIGICNLPRPVARPFFLVYQNLSSYVYYLVQSKCIFCSITTLCALFECAMAPFFLGNTGHILPLILFAADRPDRLAACGMNGSILTNHGNADLLFFR